VVWAVPSLRKRPFVYVGAFAAIVVFAISQIALAGYLEQPELEWSEVEFSRAVIEGSVQSILVRGTEALVTTADGTRALIQLAHGTSIFDLLDSLDVAEEMLSGIEIREASLDRLCLVPIIIVTVPLLGIASLPASAKLNAEGNSTQA